MSVVCYKQYILLTIKAKLNQKEDVPLTHPLLYRFKPQKIISEASSCHS